MLKCPACDEVQGRNVHGRWYNCWSCDYWWVVDNPAVEHAKQYDEVLANPPDPFGPLDDEYAGVDQCDD